MTSNKVKNDEKVDANLGIHRPQSSQELKDNLHQLVTSNRNPYFKEVGFILEAEAIRRKKFTHIINWGVAITCCLYLVLIIFLGWILYFYPQNFDWRVISLLGVILGIPAAVIFLTLVHALKQPYRIEKENDATQKSNQNEEITLFPVMQAGKETISLLEKCKELLSFKSK